jgi:hypothetical protein
MAGSTEELVSKWQEVLRNFISLKDKPEMWRNENTVQ